MRNSLLVAVGFAAFCAAVLAGVGLLARPLLIPSASTTAKAVSATADAGKTGTTTAGDGFRVTADTKGMPGLQAPPGATIAPMTSTDGVAVVRLSGVKPVAQPSGRPGIFLPVTASFELAASGQTVRVTVTARSAAQAPSPGFAVAYSTSDVGNSGWRRFPLTDSLESYSFIYAVPKMKDGNGDFIGLLPDPSGADGALEVSTISAEVLPPGTAATP